MSEEIKHHLFYSNKSPYCGELLIKIKQESMKDYYNYYCIDDPIVRAKLPPSITKVPTLIVKGIKKPLIGREVFSWLDTQKYINLTSNNITNISNPDFYVDPTIGKTNNINFAAMNDADDKGMNCGITYVEDFDNMRVTDNINKRYIDKKINNDVQKRKLAELIASRNNDLENILNANKKF
jgi:hypothetical protein